MSFRRIVCLISFLWLAYLDVSAQGTSNKGTDFWLVYANHVSGYATTIGQDMNVYVTSDVNTTGTLSIPGISYSTNFSVTANAITTIVIPQNAYIGNAEGKFQKGIHITSEKPVVSYAHIYDSSISGATLVLPTNTLGKDYYSINYTQISNSNNSFSFFCVVAVEDNTQIIITPTVNTLGGLQANVASAPITLNKGEVYQVFGTKTSNVNPFTGTDLTGSKIQSVSTGNQPCKKIAVFSGSGKISIGCLAANGTAGSADNLFQQVYPTATWGKSFITVPSKNRNYDVYRIFKSDPSAVVKVDGNVIPSASFVNNLYYEFSSQKVHFIESDKAIQAVQYQVTQNKSINCTNLSGDVGDPEMIFLNPLEQTLTKISMFSTSQFNILRHYINVVIRSSDVSTFTIDGASAASNFSPVTTAPGYSYAQIEVPAGTHTLSAASGFNAIAYGFGGAESYGYAAGASLISQGIEVQSSTQSVVRSAGCINQPYDLDVSLPYVPTKLTLDLGDGQPPSQIPITQKGTFQQNNITYYKFELAKAMVFGTVKKYKFILYSEKPTSDGCGSTDELNFDFDVFDNPVATFTTTITDDCLNNPITFTDNSIGNGSTITKWYWDYGDGQLETRTSAAPFQHNYTAPGDYVVKLSVETDAGCVSPVVSNNIHIYPLPVADFSTNSPQCVSDPIVFTDKSTVAEGSVSQWFWDFGDGSPVSNLQNPSHTYATDGIKTIKFYVISSNGCKSAEVTKTVEIYPLPVANFTSVNEACQNAEVQFTDASTSNAGITKWTWDFGDNSPTTDVQNPKHIYTVPGNYTVKLTVINANNCVSAVYTKPIEINALPVTQFAANATVCKDVPLSFTDQSTSASQITSWLWNFGDNTTSTAQNPSHTYTTAGTKNITLTTTNSKGCSTTSLVKQVIVYELPVAKFANSTLTCVNRPITFTDQSSTLDGNVNGWSWDFGDGTPLSTQQNPQHSFATSGTFTIKLIVTSDKSCVSVATTKTITINPLPVVDFETPDICLRDAAAKFTNKSTASNGANMTYLWNFGDPGSGALNTSTAKDPVHTYSSAKSYQVTLTVTPGNDNCDITVVKTFTVNGSTPVAMFAAQNENTLCSDQPVNFVDKASVDFGQVTKIEWFFDVDNNLNNPAYRLTDDSPALRSDPSKIYAFKYPTFNSPFQKTVRVRMIAYSGTQCFSSFEKVITLRAVPKVDFTLPSDCLINGKATFTDQSTIGDAPSNLTYLWNFGDPSSSSNTSTSKDGVHAFSKAQAYTVTLTVTSQDGCPVTVSKVFNVSGTIPQADFDIVNAGSLCSKNTVAFRDLAKVDFGELSKIEWHFDVSGSPNDQAYTITDNAPASRSASPKTYLFQYPVFYSPATKTISVRMRAYSGATCVNEVTREITLKAVPEVLFNPIPDFCVDAGKVQLTQAEEIHKFLPGTGVYSGKGVNAQGVFDATSVGVGTYTLTYTFTADNGCSDSKTQTVTVNPLPVMTTGPDVVVLEGGQIVLPATANGSNLTFKWTPSSYLDKDDVLNPLSKPLDDITYTLTVTSDKGCSSQGKIFVKVLKAPEVPNTFTPNGDGINDVWNIKYLDSYPDAVIDVFTRYGEKVFSGTNFSLSWDGRNNGKDLPAGTYYYIINPKNGRKIVSGSVTLIR